MAKAPPWTPEQDECLTTLVQAGREYRVIARKMRRTVYACRLRASFLGLKMGRAAVLENRQRGRERFLANPVKVERHRKRLVKASTPLDRAIRAEEARQRNLAGTLGVREHSLETRQKISNALKGRRYTDEHRRKISEARKRYWALKRTGGVDLDAYRAVIARRPKIAGDMEGHAVATIWCGQCDRQVRPDEAAICTSQWCKARQAA